MAWKCYPVVFRLRSPLHIGRGKVGNVQLTRPYVTGRVLWGALTERLTRDDFQGKGPATDSKNYEDTGKTVHDKLAFTYFYPTTDEKGVVNCWPWDKGKGFRPRFLSTYASTALTYPQQSAEEGSLHEVECIVPHTLDKGEPVYLAGYIFAQDGAPDWKSALERLQMGGERGYGWGRVEPLNDNDLEPQTEKTLFGGRYTLDATARRPVLRAAQDTLLLSHALAADFGNEQAVSGIDGVVEPLVGREVDPDTGRFGVHLSQARICYAPGAVVTQDTTFTIGRYGIWTLAPSPQLLAPSPCVASLAPENS